MVNSEATLFTHLVLIQEGLWFPETVNSFPKTDDVKVHSSQSAAFLTSRRREELSCPFVDLH